MDYPGQGDESWLARNCYSLDMVFLDGFESGSTTPWSLAAQRNAGEIGSERTTPPTAEAMRFVVTTAAANVPLALPLIVDAGLAHRLAAFHQALAEVTAGRPSSPEALAAGIAALTGLAGQPPAPADLSSDGWQATRLEVPFNRTSIISATGPASEELTLQVDTTGAPFLATWAERTGGAITDSALFDVVAGAGGFDLRVDGRDLPCRTPLGPLPPGSVVWTRNPIGCGTIGGSLAAAVPAAAAVVGAVAAGIRAVAGAVRSIPDQLPPPADAPPASLLVVAGPHQGTRFHLAPTTTVGRGDDATVTLVSRTVSRRHAAVQWRDGGYWVEDLGSSYGTEVNGRKLTAARRLEPGDEITVGLCRLRYEVAPEAATSPPAPAPTVDRCGACGREFKPDERFCAWCGQRRR